MPSSPMANERIKVEPQEYSPSHPLSHESAQPDSQGGFLLKRGLKLSSQSPPTTTSQSSPPMSGQSLGPTKMSSHVPTLTQRVSPQLVVSSTASKSPFALMASQGGEAPADPLTESRTIYKVKRFLCTLIHFGTDISPETGEKVKELVFNLVAATISVSEFHQVLQEVTNFPLRAFVLPFLKSNIPLLSRDVATLAVLTAQSPLQYLKSHQQLLLEMPTGSGTEPNDIFNSDSNGNASMVARFNGKRKSSISSNLGSASSSSSGPFTPTANDSAHQAQASLDRDGGEGGSDDFGPESGVKRLKTGENGDGLGKMSTIRQQQRVYPHSWRHQASLFGAREGLNGGSPNEGLARTGTHMATGTPHQHDEEWKNIHVMLNCILGMVDKTKRALAILQQRQMGQLSPPNSSGTLHDYEVGSPRRRQSSANIPHQSSPQSTMNEILAATLRNTEERVIEVRRRAEEAVQEVKKAAMSELQRAVAMAEKRAMESVATERIKIEKILMMETTKKEKDDTSSINDDGVSTGSLSSTQIQCCWNCGRSATETCSGCNLARYCSQFCQHKDWESHHKICGFTKNNSSIATNNNNNDNEDSKGSPPTEEVVDKSERLANHTDESQESVKYGPQSDKTEL